MCAEQVSHPLPPVCFPDSKVLILGSFPSPKSREVSFYYGNPQNRFWLVLSRLWDEPLPWGKTEAELNGARLSFCRAHHIALWDVLASCTIEGASDASISNPVPNNLSQLLAQAPLKHIFCTGAVAAKLYAKLIEPEIARPCIALPSTSPANAAWSVEKLVEAYKPVRLGVEGKPPLCPSKRNVRK